MLQQMSVARETVFLPSPPPHWKTSLLRFAKTLPLLHSDIAASGQPIWSTMLQSMPFQSHDDALAEAFDSHQPLSGLFRSSSVPFSTLYFALISPNTCAGLQNG